MNQNRVSEKCFTRNRKLPFTSLVIFMLNIIKQTLQKELTNFMKLISKKDKNITKSAFSQSRMKLKPEAFIELNDVLVEEFYTDNIIKKWKGFRLLSMDGTKLNLPFAEDILNEFGDSTNQSGHKTPTAQASTCFDLLNEIILDAQIEHNNTSEYISALKHMEKVRNGDLLIFDRGYGAMWLFYYLLSNKIDFLFRVSKLFLTKDHPFLISDAKSVIVEINKISVASKRRLEILGLKFKPFKIRFIKVFLDNGDIEYLVTSLTDEDRFPTEIFKELYHKRWGIEVNYDHLKSNLRLEDWTGKTPQAIKQDFYANMLIVNIQMLIAGDAQLELDKEKKGRKLKYKVNKNLSLGYLKDRVVDILTSNNPKYYEELRELFKIEPVSIRKGRKFPRNFNLNQRRHHMNRKKSV